MDIRPDSITLIDTAGCEYTSWYITDEGQFLVEVLKAKKYEYLGSDKCKHITHQFNAFFDAYVYVMLRYDLKPSELAMSMEDSEGRVFTYDRYVASCAVRNTQHG